MVRLNQIPDTATIGNELHGRGGLSRLLPAMSATIWKFMKYDAVMAALRSYVAVGGQPANIFLLTEGGVREIYNCIVSNSLRSCLELGSGFGATSCVMGAAVAETGGKVITVD